MRFSDTSREDVDPARYDLILGVARRIEPSRDRAHHVHHHAIEKVGVDVRSKFSARDSGFDHVDEDLFNALEGLVDVCEFGLAEEGVANGAEATEAADN